MAQVRVIKSTTEGIHLAIDGQEIGFNKTTGVFKAKGTDGKWAAIKPSNYIRAIATRKLEDAIYRAKKIERAGTFRKSANWFDNQAFLAQERNA